MTALLTILACIVLLPFAIVILVNLVLPLLWKLKYVFLGLVAALGVIYYIGCGIEKRVTQTQSVYAPTQPPVEDHNSPQYWFTPHPELVQK